MDSIMIYKDQNGWCARFQHDAYMELIPLGRRHNETMTIILDHFRDRVFYVDHQINQSGKKE